MKTAIFVDVQNIYYTTRDIFKRSFNYKRFWNQVESNNEIILANAYAVDKGDEKQKKFQYALQTIGFNVKLKPYISRTDGSAKGDWDVGITIDVLDSAKKAEKTKPNSFTAFCRHSIDEPSFLAPRMQAARLVGTKPQHGHPGSFEKHTPPSLTPWSSGCVVIAVTKPTGPAATTVPSLVQAHSFKPRFSNKVHEVAGVDGGTVVDTEGNKHSTKIIQNAKRKLCPKNRPRMASGNPF